MTQKKLATYGATGRTVRVFLERDLVRVQWRELGRRRTESWPDSRDNRVRARAFAEGVAKQLDRRGATVDREPLTLHQLWLRYTTAEAPSWREATLRNATAHWRSFTAVAGDARMADDVTADAMDEWRARLLKRPAKGAARSPVQVARTCGVVRRVFAWAAQRGLLESDPLAAWRPKLAKDDKPLDVGEFRPEEVRAILGACDRRQQRQWRPWVVFTLAATLGRRQRAILNLRCADVDLTARTVTWRAETDKQGRAATVPLPRAAVHALRVARVWCAREGKAGGYVLPAVQDRRAGKPWTYQAANQALKEAEARAGIPHRPYRALHGFRRGVVTTIHRATGDLELAGEFVGDTDVRTLRRSYLKTRPEALADAARIAGAAVGAGDDE